MNSLNKAIEQAFLTNGSQKEANKAYIEFIKANFIIPIENREDTEDPHVLFLEECGQIFLPVFTDTEYLHRWATEINSQIKILKLSGVDLLKGIQDEVSVSLNIGSEFYKEFAADEIRRMKSLVLKFFKD